MFDFYFITGISGDKGKKQETRQALHLLVRDCYPGRLTPKSPESLEKALFFRQIKFCVYGNTVIYVV